MTKYKYLDKINFPSDLKTLELNELKILAEELRTELIEVVSETLIISIGITVGIYIGELWKKLGIPITNIKIIKCNKKEK